MRRRTRNITALGALTLLAAALFVWGMNYLLGNPILQGGMDLAVRLDDGAGLKRGDRVHVQGVEIGTVRNVNLTDGRTVVVDVRIQGNLALPTDTRATVQGDVFGAHTIELQPGVSLLRLGSGDTIQGGAAPQITDIAANLSEKAEAVLTGVDSLLSPKALSDVHATAAVLPESAAELRAAFMELRAAAAALRRTAEGVEEARTGDAVAGAVAEVERSAEALTAAVEKVDRSFDVLSSVLAKIDRGEGTLGRLVNDSSLYVGFTQAVREMGLLAADIRERPGRYINLRIF
ncbi:MAG: MlaD family protein [Gemmatimonadota bacterium]|jgi:phospholipid/cholesterol/gamma-HCH transport system substrate-binding protein